MKKLIFFLSLSICFISLTHKDNAEFKGKVLDDQTGDPIPYAEVVHLRSKTKSITDINGAFILPINPILGDKIRVTYVGYEFNIFKISSLESCEIRMKHSRVMEEEAVTMDVDAGQNRAIKNQSKSQPPAVAYELRNCWTRPNTSESYDEINENQFLSVHDHALSTFSIDVDGAAYSNVRRFINRGHKPPIDAVRIEELINYFDYNYDVDIKKEPFGLHYEIGECPWNSQHHLVHIGIQGKEIESNKKPASNLVFLIDVSGSMRNETKLPLLIKAFNMLVNQLDKNDKVSIVTYAGNAGIVLNPTTCDNKTIINNALNNLRAGGSTAGAQGIITAYKLAEENFIKEGNNRVILATDGDFNVGMSSDHALEKLIEEKRSSGIFLNVLGFGMGNYKDSKMQRIANHGNGQHAYIDNIHEARKVFVDELQGSLFTIAKDVKVQIEFNPVYVEHYRLIGYENRLLADRDFNDDTKDAGEIGAGHSVTALYEIVPVGTKSNINNVDPLKYQSTTKKTLGPLNGELATLKIRYKEPNKNISKKQVWILDPMETSVNPSEQFYWSAAMACFGMTLRSSDHLVNGNYALAESLALKGKGGDHWGYRSEALSLIRSASALFENTTLSSEGE